MNLYQFQLLEKNEQQIIIGNQAVFLAQRIDGDYTYKLFQIDGFYVEEQWHTKFDERRSYITFISQELLKPYIDKLDISNLLLSTKI